jgi:enterochelin esterase family protein
MGRLVLVTALCATAISVLHGAAVTPQRERAVASPQVGSDRRVTFRLAADATRVDVILAASPAELGTGAATRLAMRKDGGVWTAVSEPLVPDIYAYQFAVGGKTFNDPEATRFIEEFAGDRTSAFAVPGALWTTAGAPEGVVTRHRYSSPAIGGAEEYSVYTPPGYDSRGSTAYPTLYLLHGMADNAYTWVTNGGVNVTLDNLIAQRKATPMVVVMPLGYGGSGGALMELAPFERALLDEIIPQVEKTHRVSRRRDARAIAGVSMGGAQAMSIGLRHADAFAWLGSLSGAFDQDTSAEPARLDRDRFALIYLGWGADDALAPGNRRFAAALKSRGADPTIREAPGVGHVWPLWRQMVGDLLQLLFKPAAR